MAKSLQERCDKVIGEKGADFMAIASYKAGPAPKEGEDDTRETRYHYGVNLNYPDFDKLSKADRDKILVAGIDRFRSVDQAPFKAKILAGEMTAAEIEAWAKKVDGENFLIFLNTVKEKAVKAVVDTTITLARRQLASDLRDGTISADKIKAAKTPLPAAPLDKNGKVNYVGWVKLMEATKHPWFVVYHNKAIADKKKAPAGLD